jgi:AraC-like DNA-binding protein
MTRRIRGLALQGYEAAARAHGLDPAAHLRAAGLPADALSDPDRLLDLGAVNRLLESSAEKSGVHDFGLRMARARGLSGLDDLLALMRLERDLGAAFARLARTMPVLNPQMPFQIHERDGAACFRFDLMTQGGASARQGMELAAGLLMAMLRHFLGAAWRPDFVAFSHDAPRGPTLHRRVLGAVVVFGCDFDGIVCDGDVLRFPIAATPSPEALAARRRYDDALAAVAEIDAHRVRRQIRFLLSEGRCGADEIAAHFRVDRRTVARKLAASGDSLSALTDEVRRELCLRYLNHTNRPLTEIGALLGFSELSAFSRWFRRQFGCTAGMWRQQAKKQFYATPCPTGSSLRGENTGSMDTSS